jgi:hypothetical protein
MKRAHIVLLLTIGGMAPACASESGPATLLLKDYRPRSIYNLPQTTVTKAKYPVIDMHSHPSAKTPEQVARWVRTMDEMGIEKTIILTYTTGRPFDDLHAMYSKYPARFE